MTETSDSGDVGIGPNRKMAFKCVQNGTNKGKIWESTTDFIDDMD
jgi:hypothetical protein